MGLLRPREERRDTFLRARIRADDGWSDVTIGNVSSRGLMLQCPAPPAHGSFVEIRHHHLCIVGRIVWTHGSQCGLRTQDVIDVRDILSPVPRKQARPGEERRAAPRPRHTPRRPAAAEVAASSQRFARAFDWRIMALAVAAAGALVAHTAWAVLDGPMARAEAALALAN
jgi:hypothetical protein